MVQIRLDTDYARGVGRQLKAESDHLEQVGRELQNAISSLDTQAWDGVSRWRAEPLLGRVHSESAHIAHELDELGYKLVRVADILEQIDITLVHEISQPTPFDPTWLPGVAEDWDLGRFLAAIIGLADDTARQILDRLLPADLAGEEYIMLRGEGGVIIPLAEFDLPFSGYLNGEQGITLKRNENGTYSVIIGRAGGVGVDFSYDEVGAQVGLRGEQGYEFAFDPNHPGDLSKMTMFLSALGASKMLSTWGIPGMEQITESVAMSALKDNMISMSGGVGIEGQAEFDLGPIGEIDIDGTVMVGAEMRRGGLDDSSWESVASCKLTRQVEGKLPALDALKAEGKLGFELTFNDIADTQTGQRSSEVVLQIQASAGTHLSLDEITGALPPGVSFDIDATGVDAIGQLEIVYRLDSPVESAIGSVREGNFDSIIENSYFEVKASSGTAATVGGEFKKSIMPGQTVGGSLEVEVSSGSTVTVYKHDGPAKQLDAN